MTDTIYKLSIEYVKLFIITTVIVAVGNVWGYTQEIGVQLLSDPGFEESIPNGTFPTSGAWAPSWLGQSGQICTTTASRSGSVGLYIYTGSGGTSWRSDPYQTVDKTAEPGDVFTSEIWARSLSSWVSGSKMLVRLTFLNSSHSPIVSKDSTPLTTASSGWTKLTVVTDPAPPGTVYIRYRLYLAKPGGASGQSIGNFDDCYLELTSQSSPVPRLDIYPQALGITKDQTQAQFTIKNIGDGSLNWNLTESESWITGISPTSGTTAAGTDTIVTVTVNRAGLPGDSYKGFINVTSDGGDETVIVYMDMANGYSVPTAPSLVTTDGYRVLIQKRLPDGSLDTIRPYVIKGVAWSPSSLGSNGDINERRSDFHNWFTADIQLIKEMNANTVYTFLDFGTGAEAADILDNLYKNGIMAIVTVDEDGSNNTAKITEIVNAYKNHPAILMWAIGNEWNINYYHDKFGSHLTPTTAKLLASAEATELAAQQIKGLDTMHPAASIHGEIDIDNRQPLTPVTGYLSTQEIVNDVCPSVNLWGVNIYRGDNFGTLFSQWASIADKPLFLSEFGTDSYYTTGWYDPVVGYESETDQGIWLDSLWTDIEPEISAYDVDKVCLGGTVFEWSDEWWKIPPPGGNPAEHDNGGFDTPWNQFAHPDGFANEEYFGVVHISRKAKQVYTTLQAHFAVVSNFAPTAIPFEVTTEQGVPLSITLQGTDVEGAVLTYEIVDNPVNGNLTTVSGSSVTYTSFAGYIGVDSFTFRCFDGAKYSSPAAVSITVVPLPSITVLSPNGGEDWPAGSTQNITWTANALSGDITIDLYKGGVYHSHVGTTASAPGSLQWDIPPGSVPGNDYQLRIYQGSTGDYSDSYFSIIILSPFCAFPDFNKDGRADVIWRYDAPEGYNAVWLLGTSGVSSALTEVYSHKITPAGLLAKMNGDTGEGIPQKNVWESVETYWTVPVKDGFAGQTHWNYNASFVPGPFAMDNKAHQNMSRAMVSSVTDPRDDPQAVELIAVADQNWKLSGTGDFNGDGNIDIVWSNVDTAHNCVWYMDGTTYVGYGRLPDGATTDWVLGGVGDFDRDGNPDLIWHNEVDGRNGVWYLEGVQLKGIDVMTTGANVNWKLSGTGDFNNDGHVDLVWRNISNGSNAVWYMDGVELSSVGWLDPVANLNWKLRGTGDFNSDGKIDLIWTYISDGRNAVWYLDDVTLIGAEFLTTVTDTTWIIEN